MRSVTVVIPTYNERENISLLLDALLGLNIPDLSVLVVDDSSPDGTGDAVASLAASDARVALLSRKQKEGLGRAYTAAFQHLLHSTSKVAGDVVYTSDPAKPDAPSGLSDRAGMVRPEGAESEGAFPEPRSLGGARKARGAGEPGSDPVPRQDPPQIPDIIVQMDGDLSHNPADVPKLLAALEKTDLAIGSRYVRGGGTANWALKRRLLSRGANAYARMITGVPANDLTGGFNAWRASLLSAIRPSTIAADGYGYLIELKVRAARRGARIVEVPILFTERRTGVSKLSKRVMWEAAGVVLRLGSEPWKNQP